MTTVTVRQSGGAEIVSIPKAIGKALNQKGQSHRSFKTRTQHCVRRALAKCSLVGRDCERVGWRVYA